MGGWSQHLAYLSSIHKNENIKNCEMAAQLCKWRMTSLTMRNHYQVTKVSSWAGERLRIKNSRMERNYENVHWRASCFLQIQYKSSMMTMHLSCSKRPCKVPSASFRLELIQQHSRSMPLHPWSKVKRKTSGWTLLCWHYMEIILDLKKSLRW